jgi:large subunit ribosomal protein L10
VNRQEKEVVVAELHDRFSRASVALLAVNRGLTVEESTELRRKVREAGGEMRVAKHTLTKIALNGTVFGDLSKLLAGPSGLVFGFDDPVGVAKVLVDFARDHEKLGLDGGALEGQLIPANRVEDLAKMPDLPSLQARIARQVLSPGSRVASQVAAPAARVAGAIQALVKRLEEGGAAA